MRNEKYGRTCKIFYTFEECVEYCRANKITTSRSYEHESRKNRKLPRNPYFEYKGKFSIGILKSNLVINKEMEEVETIVEVSNKDIQKNHALYINTVYESLNNIKRMIHDSEIPTNFAMKLLKELHLAINSISELGESGI